MLFQTHYCCQNSSCCSVFDFVLISAGFFANYRSKLLFSVLVLSLILCHFKGKMLHLLPLYTSSNRSIVVIYTPSHVLLIPSHAKNTSGGFDFFFFLTKRPDHFSTLCCWVGCFLFSFFQNICLFSQISGLFFFIYVY